MSAIAGTGTGLVVEADLTLGGFRLSAEVSAAAGRVTALLGPNGAGKTTLLRCVQGALALDGGRITLGGRVLDAPPGVHVPPERRRVGVVHQDYLLFPHLSVVDNVAFGLRARGARRRSAREEATGWLRRVGLAGHDLARPRTLSGGQAQRVALARALAPGPDALLLDEPLAALDAGSRPQVRADLRRFLGDYPGVTLLVTHDPADARALADDVVVLEGGRVAESGRWDEVAAAPRSRYLADLLGPVGP